MINEEFKELRTDNIGKDHYRNWGFYVQKNIYKNDIGLYISYLLKKIAIFCEIEKKNLKNIEGLKDAFWTSERVEIDKYDVLKEQYIGLDLHGQIDALKSWGRKCLQKFIEITK